MVGGTQLKPKSWVGARDCCGSGAWTRKDRKRGLERRRHKDETGRKLAMGRNGILDLAIKVGMSENEET